VRALLRFFGILAFASALLFVVVFFWFQSFIVYTADGVRLDIPFLRGILDEIPEDASPDPLLPPVAETPPPFVGLPEEPGLPVEIDDFRTVLVRAADLSNVAWDLAIHGLDVDGVLISMNNPSGMLWWDAEVPYAHSFELSGTGDPLPYFEQMGENTQYSALLYAFQNQLLATRNPGLVLTGDFLDPANADVQAYVTDLALDLVRLGFDEIVLTGFAYPPNYQSEAHEEALLSFLTDLSNVLRVAGASLSVMTQEADWIDAYGSPVSFHPSFATLASIVDRFYCVLSPDTAPNSEQFLSLLSTVETILGPEMHRFVPSISGTRPNEGNWLVIPEAGELFS